MLSEVRGGESSSGRYIFLKRFLVAVTNPKGYLFFSAFVPQFIAPTSPQAARYMILEGVFASIDFLVMFAYAMFGSQVVHLLRNAGTLWIDRVCGGALLALALSLAFYRRTTA
jgi:threonine/homoserine/homoserine lactone efflux protein